MEKRVSLIIISLVFISLFSILVYAEKLDIEIGNSYNPGDEANFKIVLYDDENNKIEGSVGYIIQNYYTEVVKKGSANSGEEVSFKVPGDAIQGPWKIIASYNEIEINRLFNIGGLAKAEIVLQEDNLIVTNTGNIPYEKRILIFIGENDQTADIYLDVGQTKRIRLTAPDEEYDVRVIEGNEEQVLEFKGVSLTGNVIGLESVIGEGFWRKYPIVGVFLIALLLVIVVVGVLKFKNKSK
jgi:ribosomal protein L19